ncbi:hypothetical protein KR093_001256, partial [Drosophila rubida]
CVRRLKTVQSNEAAAETTNEKPKRTHRFFHRDQPPTRTRSSVTRNVYEFLSESQIDDNATNQRKDAAADIIKKMVEEGRACAVMRSKTGKSRARCVRKRVRPVGKRKQCSLKSTPAKDKVEQSHQFQMEVRPLSPIYEPEQDEENNQSGNAPVIIEDRPLSPIYGLEQDEKNNQSDDAHVIIDAVAQVHTTQQQEPRKSISTHKGKTMMEGAYSPLARSLLLNQTNNQNALSSLERRRQLLQVARKFYSTPMNRKNVTAEKNSTLSPILFQTKQNQRPPATVVSSPNGGCSPWRVPEEALLPNTFTFGFNTSQLPSYSSDYIKRRHVYVPDEPKERMGNEYDSKYPVLNEQSVDSAANDSNGENVPPIIQSVASAVDNCIEKTVPPIELSAQKNENDENFVQLPNPRRTLQQRTPLKDINILDVVVLPSWKNKMQLPKTPNRENVSKNQICSADSIRNTIGKSPRQQLGVHPERTKSPHKTPVRENISKNHVHFADFIENSISKSPRQQLDVQAERQTQSSRNLFGFEEFLSEDEVQCNTVQQNNANSTLIDKMQRLKSLRPTDKELPQLSKAPLRYDYDDLTTRTPKQRNIKEMLCSTMVATPPCGLAADESRGLFKDMDPDVTFDEKKPRRTYVRERPKRKRKQRVHVLFIETDSSESENDEQDSNDKSADSPRKAVPQKKRVRRDVEHDAKLRQFITSFNQECEEVENFPLIIE